MIGVIVPARNEEALIGACLSSIRAAASMLGSEDVCTFVALDRCVDGTAGIAAAFGAHTVIVSDGNVGRARAAAAEYALRCGARWIASTDADSRVPADWLVGQLASAADAFVGTVDVDDKEYRDMALAARFRATQHHCDGHPHVHGANLGVAALWYRRCGGFSPLPAHEDVVFVRSLEAAGAAIARLAHPRVLTSTRRIARAGQGFASYLQGLMSAPSPAV